MELEKINDYIYEIPQTEEMNVPGRVFASDELIDQIKEDRTLGQVKNMAKLPGIEKYSICMPDGHQGYGFPIGGVAAFNKENGIISPGGIGFDINCLTGDSEVLLQNGRKTKIKDLKHGFEDEKAIVADQQATESDIILFTETENKQVYKIETETGETLEATEDHPILAEKGMKEVSKLQKGSRIYIRPFEGIEDEKPPEKTLLTEEDFRKEDQQLIEALKERNLLPLKTSDEKFNILLKLIGFHTGDGAFNNHGETTFYAAKEDLKKIQKDIEKLGYRPSPIYSRERTHQVRQEPFTVTENSVKSTAKSLQKLLQKLGTPKGKKTQQEFRVPQYVHKLANWQKALYLSAFFGAEMNAPSAQADKNYYCPKVSQNKSIEVKESGRQFMEDIKKLLSDLQIETNKIEEFETHKNQDGRVYRYRIGVKNDTQNLINFYTKISYRYNLEKQKKAVKAVQYLKTKQKAIQRRKNISKKAVELYESGMGPKEIKEKFEINNRFIDRSIYSGRKTSPRPPKNFPSIEEYTQDIEVKDNLAVKTTIRSIEKKEKETVYDIGVKNAQHNFQANQFIVSNCGIRVLKTNLSLEDIEGREKQIVNILYQKVPVGLGKGGYIDADEEDVKEILEKGVEWMLEKGEAQELDLENCEENGRLPGDPEKVPEKAIKRGIKQVGSLGSGNHFLEVQAVQNVFDNEKAEAYGLEENQVIVMIHSGSRGLGHQVCSEYLREFEKEYPEIAEELPEKNLMYAPIDSQLGQDYKDAMYAAANFAWVNRQAMTQATRECLNTIFEEVETELLYDVCHNIAKEETHTVEGEEKELIVHRKGATRSFPSGRKEVPENYEEVGQPVLIPGSMGTSSYILSGGEKSLELSFGSTAHGAGRIKSRTQAKEDYWGEEIQKDLKREDITVKARSPKTIAEEAPGAYKDIDQVIEVSDKLGIGEKVVQLAPIINIKG